MNHELAWIRPEAFRLAEEGIPLTVDLVEELGSDAYLHGVLQHPGGGSTAVVVRVDGCRPPAVGTLVHLTAEPGEAHLFDADSWQRIEA